MRNKSGFLVSEIAQWLRGRSGIRGLVTRLNHVVLAVRNGALDVLRRTEGILHGHADLRNAAHQFLAKILIPHQALLRVVELSIAWRLEHHAVIELSLIHISEPTRRT